MSAADYSRASRIALVAVVTAVSLGSAGITFAQAKPAPGAKKK